MSVCACVCVCVCDANERKTDAANKCAHFKIEACNQ